jgi:hypothetical protein
MDSVACARVLVAAYVLLIGAHDFSWVSKLPAAFFYPPGGPFALLQAFPPQWALQLVRYVLVAAALCLLFGVRPLLAGASTSLMLLFSYGAAYCAGKTTHNILFVLAPWVIGAAAEGRKRNRSWPIAVFALVLTFLMLTAALPKLAFGWLNPRSAAVYGYALEAQVLRAPLLRGLPPSALWELLDWATVAFESAFAFCSWRARWFRATCAVAIVFHATVFFMLDISFASNIVAYCVFFDWRAFARAPLVTAATSRLPQLPANVRFWGCAAVAAVYVFSFREAPLNELLHVAGVADHIPVFATAGDILLTCCAALAAIGYLGWAAYPHKARSAARVSASSQSAVSNANVSVER